MRDLEKKTKRNLQNQIRRLRGKVDPEEWGGYYRRALFIAIKQAKERQTSEGLIKDEEV